MKYTSPWLGLRSSITPTSLRRPALTLCAIAICALAWSTPSIVQAEVTSNLPIINGQAVTRILEVGKNADGSDRFAAEHDPHDATHKPPTSGRYIVRHQAPAIVQKLSQAFPVGTLSSVVTAQDQTVKKRLTQVTRSQRATIKKEQDAFEVRLNNLGAPRPVKHFQLAINASVLELNRTQVESLLADGYDVQEESLYYPALDVSANLIGAPLVWQQSSASGTPLDGRGVRVGIIDTGIDYTHPDFGSCPRTENINTSNCAKVVGGKDFVTGDLDPWDENTSSGHGTHVAATVAGNGFLKGIAPGASLYALKVFSAAGGTTEAVVLAAIEYSLDPNEDGDYADRLDVINLSLGGPGNSNSTLALALDHAALIGVIPVVAAGNSGPSSFTIGSPGTSRMALTVGATYKQDYDQSYDGQSTVDQITGFSSRGFVISTPSSSSSQPISILNKPDIVAPGSQICAAKSSSVTAERTSCGNNTQILLQGTSMAAPHVAGVAALVRQKHPSWSVAEVKAAIRNTAITLNDPATGQPYAVRAQGRGRVDALAAVNAPRPAVARLELRASPSGHAFELFGTANAHDFVSYHIERSMDGGATWIHMLSQAEAVIEGSLGIVALNSLPPSELSLFRLRVLSSSDIGVDYAEGSPELLASPVTPQPTIHEDPVDGRLVITWDVVPGQEGMMMYLYRVDRENQSGTPMWSAYTFRMNQLRYPYAPADGTEYVFKIRAQNPNTGQQGSLSNAVSHSRRGSNESPLSPVNVQATTDRDDGVLVTWEPNSLGADATRHYVYRFEFGEASAVCPHLTLAESIGWTFGTSLLDTAADPGMDYHYAVLPVSTEYNSGVCGELALGRREIGDPIGPQPPRLPTATVVVDSQGRTVTRFTWEASPDPDISGYKMYFTEVPSCLDTGWGPGVNASTFHFDFYSPPTGRYWSMQSVKNGVAGRCTDPQLLPLAIDPLGPPEILHVTRGEFTDKITISFHQPDDAERAEYFEVYRREGGLAYSGFRCFPDAHAPIGTIPAQPGIMTFNDTTARPGVQYAYQVRAASADRFSPCSRAKLGNTHAALDISPSPLQVRQVGPSVEVEWTPIYQEAGELLTGYELFRSEDGQICQEGQGHKTLPGGVSKLTDTLVHDWGHYTYSMRTISRSGDRGSCVALGSVTVQAPANCGGDVNEDGRTDGADLSVLLFRFGQQVPQNTAGDLNGDGVVDGLDLSVLLARFGCSSVLSAPIEAPASISASRWLADRVRVNWSPVVDAFGYEVQYSQNAEGPFSSLDYVEARSTDDLTVTPRTKRFYRVRAHNVRGSGPWSEVVEGQSARTFLARPLGLAASEGTLPAVVRLTWSGQNQVSHYEIHRSLDRDDGYTLLGTSQGTSYLDSSIESGVTYWYKVRAADDGEVGAFSSPDSGFGATVSIPPPPTEVTASDGTSVDSVVVSWSHVPLATGYRVERASSVDGAFTNIGEVTGQTFTDLSAAPSITYWYRIRSMNSAGVGSPSQADSGFRGSPNPPQTPSGLVTTPRTNGVQLNWTATPSAISYKIYRASGFNGPYTLRGTATAQALPEYLDQFSEITCYLYKVSAVNASGESPMSAHRSGCRVAG